MDFSGSQQDATDASGDPSTMTDLNKPARKDTAANESLTTDEQQSVYATDLAVEDTVTSAQADAAETVDEWFVSAPSSPINDPMESQPAAFSRIKVKSTLQGFEALHAGVLKQLDRAREMNEDGDSTILKEHTISCLLQSVQLGIGEMQACVVHFCCVLLV